MSKDFYPLPAFFFGISIDDNEGIDSRFQEVTGLEAEMEMEEIARTRRDERCLFDPAAHSRIDAGSGRLL